MKAVMLAMRYLTNAFGNIIDVAVIALLEGKLGSQVGSKIRTFIYALNNRLWIIETTFHVAFIFNLSIYRRTNSFCLPVLWFWI